MLNDFFKVSKEEVEKAKSGGIPKFEEGETPTFLIEELKENEKDGKKSLKIGTKIMDGKNEGKSYPHMVYENKSFLVNLLSCFYTEAEIMGGGFNPEDMVGRKFKARVVKSKSKKNDKIYTNFYDLEAVSDVPDMPDTVTDAEVEEAVANSGPTEADEQLF